MHSLHWLQCSLMCSSRMPLHCSYFSGNWSPDNNVHTAFGLFVFCRFLKAPDPATTHCGWRERRVRRGLEPELATSSRTKPRSYSTPKKCHSSYNWTSRSTGKDKQVSQTGNASKTAQNSCRCNCHSGQTVLLPLHSSMNGGMVWQAPLFSWTHCNVKRDKSSQLVSDPIHSVTRDFPDKRYWSCSVFTWFFFSSSVLIQCSSGSCQWNRTSCPAAAAWTSTPL